MKRYFIIVLTIFLNKNVMVLGCSSLLNTGNARTMINVFSTEKNTTSFSKTLAELVEKHGIDILKNPKVASAINLRASLAACSKADDLIGTNSEEAQSRLLNIWKNNKQFWPAAALLLDSRLPTSIESKDAITSTKEKLRLGYYCHNTLALK